MAITKEVNIVVKESGVEKVNQQMDNLAKSLKNADKEATNLDATFEEIYGDLQPLTARMGEAEDRLYELGLAGKQTSREYQDLLKQVGDYRKVQIQTDLAVDAAASNLSQNLTGALGSVTGGFSVAQGAMGAFGVTSETTEEALLKVQSAMAISSGFETIKQGAKSFDGLKASILSTTFAQKANTAATSAAAIVQKLFTGSVATTTVGFKLLRGAIIATGIGALIVAVGLVVANFDKFKKVLSNIGWLTAVGDAISNIVNSVTDFLGFTSESERVLDKQKQVAEKSLKQNESYLKKNEHKLSESRKREIELNNEHFQRIVDGEMTKEESLKILREKANIDKQKAQDEANKIQAEKQKEANEKAKEAQNKADEKQAELVKSRFENENNFIAEQLKNEQLTIDEKRNIVLASQELSKEDRQKFLADLQTQEIEKEKEHNQKITDLNKKFDDEKAQRLADTAVKKEELDYENQIKEIELLAQTELEKQTLIEKLNAEHLVRMGIAKKTDADKQLEEEQKIKDQILQVETAYQNAKRNALDTGLNILQEFAGKNKGIALSILALQKGLAIADVVVGASKSLALQSAALATANTGAAATPQAIATSGISAIPVIAANTALAAKGALTTKITAATSIASILASGISGAKSITAGSGDSGSTGGGSAPQSPSFNLVQGTGRNQLAESIGQQAPVKAFVVARDMSTGQEMDRNIIKSASL